ncbi:MAG TPA: hypothetical protein VFE32_14860 [Puia sp.]|jgi:hypothetical protein|nr:hypothetical protein [Puia sp.]
MDASLKEDTAAIFKVSKEGIEISGSESFVRDQVNLFKPNIQEILHGLSRPAQQPSLPAISPAIPKHASPNSLSESEDIDYIEISASESTNYENVLEIQNDRVHIITDIPGDTLAKRMINLVLVYMWGNILINRSEISFVELREVCQQHGELDKSNFSKHMTSNKKFFVILGSGKFLKAKLIRPGIKEALNLIAELNTK